MSVTIRPYLSCVLWARLASCIRQIALSTGSLTHLCLML